MRLPELQEQVFALIEREPRDRAGVHETLATVPGGRRYFEQMKAALELASRLPLEEPPACLDDRIVEAARTGPGGPTGR